MKIEALSTFLQTAFDDLLRLSHHDPEVFDKLYYNRADECARFESILHTSAKFGNNILVIGDAGVGKTNFIYKIIKDDGVHNDNNTYPIILDYLRQTPANFQTCMISFIENMLKYFNDIGKPVNDPHKNSKENIDCNLGNLCDHLNELPSHNRNKHLVIFVDDLDYADDDWFKILNHLKEFADSIRATVVLTARPPLVNDIFHLDDRFAQIYARNGQRIDLRPLHAGSILPSRIAPVLIENEQNPFHRYIKPLFNREKNTIYKICRALEINSVEEIERFYYPFTKGFDDFLNRLTNGNNREIFAIATEFILHLVKNREDFKEIPEMGVNRMYISHETIFKVLYEQEDSSYKFVSLNKYMKRGNFLLVNVLEAVARHGIINDEVLTTLSKLGHKPDEVDFALKYLSDKSKRFIYPRRIMPEKQLFRLQKWPEYEITKKGELYREIINWSIYKKNFGQSGKSYEPRV